MSGSLDPMHRYTNHAFPSYTYVPGKTPHPVRDSAGHSFGVPEVCVEHFDAAKWQACEAYLFGVDLFNSGFYWEAHEQWEAVWHSVGRQGKVADLLKGLIKLAAAGVKQAEGRTEGVRRHATRAKQLFTAVQQAHANASKSERFCGLEFRQLQTWTDRMARDGWPNEIQLTLGE